MTKKDDDGRDNHQGSTAAEDNELTLWLNRLWARNEPPSRIELYQAYGRNKADRGEMIHHEDFKPDEKLDIEQANRVANEIMAAAQNDCDSLRKEAWYQLAIVDNNRKANPLVRRVGPLQPKRFYAIKKHGAGGASSDDDDDEDTLNGQTLSLRYVKESFDQVKWEKGRNDRVVEGMLLLQDNIIKHQQGVIDGFFDKLIVSFEKRQEAEDRQTQRDIIIAKEKFKIDLWKNGVRTAQNVLPGIFGPVGGGEKKPQLDEGNGSSEVPVKTTGPKDYGSSPERTLVDNFLNQCEEDKIDIALFGDFEIREGKLVQVKPGIFTLKQFGVILGVRDGRLPVEAIDVLMPGGGHENAITEEQVNKALAAGMTEGIGIALQELMTLRQKAKTPDTEDNSSSSEK